MRFIRYFLVSVVFLLMGVIYAREVPKLKAWLLQKIQTLSSEKANLEIRADAIKFKLLPPGVELVNVKMKPRREMAAMISPATVDSVQLYLSATSLIAGRFEIGDITIVKPIGSIFIRKPSKTQTGASKKSDAWDQIINIPIQRLDIREAEIRARLEEQGLSVQLRDFSLNLVKNYKAGKLDIFAPDIMFKKGEDGKVIQLGLSSRLVAERNALEVSALKINQGSSYLIAGGLGRGDVTKLEFPLVNGRAIAHIDLAEAVALVHMISPTTSLPQASGIVAFEVTAQQQRGHDPTITAQIDAQETRIDKFQIGDFSAKFTYANNLLKSKAIKFSSRAGRFVIQDLEAKTGKETRVSGRVQVESLELHNLLSQLHVGDVPLHLDMAGLVPCEGTVAPEIHFECAGEMTGSNFRVWDKDNNKTVVALKSFKIVAQLLADKIKIMFPKALLTVGGSTGNAKGAIQYDKGFDFDYHSDKLDFSDIQSLADLKFEGNMGITGTTSGDSHAAVMQAEASPKNLWFENYGLGDGHFGIKYENGYLHLDEIAGQRGNLTYSGSATVKLGDDSRGKTGLTSAHFKFPTLDLADLQKAFSHKVTLPFQATGTGAGEVEAHGPFSLSQLNYKVKSRVTRGLVAGETFSEATFNVHGINGHAFADDIHVKKGDGLFNLSGDVLANGEMNVAISGRGLQLADFEHVHSIASGYDGKLLIDMKMTNFILKPLLTMTGMISQSTLNGQILDDSTFDASISHLGFNFKGQIFNDRIKLLLAYPFEENQPFAFKFETAGWDFSNLLGILGKSAVKRDYETNLSAKIDLSSSEGSLLKSTGSAVVSKFYVRRGPSQMKNTEPIVVKFDDGLITVQDLHLDGDNTRLGVTGTKNRKDVLNFNINGRIDMSLLMFLTPFLRDMSGDLSISTQVGGTLDKPDLLGSAFMKKGYFKLDALPQPFENITIDAAFSQSRVLVNRLAGQLGGGNLTGSGAITFKGFGNIPVELTGDLTGTSLTVPEGLVTRGDLHFGITGSWFPYLLKGDYNIEGGQYSVNMGEEQNDSAAKRSTYLPTVILQKDFIPLEVDINSHFQKGLTVKNNMFDGDVKGNIEIKGDPAHSILLGDIEALPNAKVLFRDTPFTVQEARLKFNNPSENNPVIYALATTRVRDWDISLLIQGPRSKPRIELNSTPPLPERSIVSLLALGVTDEDESRTASVTPLSPSGAPLTQQGSTAYSQAGSVLVEKNPLSQEIKRKLGVVVRLTQTEDAHNTIMPVFVAEKAWTPSFSTTASRTIGDKIVTDINLEYKLDRHFSVLGTYEGRDYDPLAVSPTGTSTNQGSIYNNILGLDLQFQLDFK